MSHARAIPSIEQLRQQPAARSLADEYGDAAVVDALRAAAAEVRRQLRREALPPDRPRIVEAITESAARRLETAWRPSMVRVINATGVVVHTNLGRAPLADAAVERVRRVAAGYTNLEYDLDAGSRGARDVHAERLLCQLTGAEAAVVVNNCAAATMLALAAIARGREVIVSRQELVEIGGGFRVPEVLAQSGARLREVGTTNRTRAADYALAIGERTGAILRVHPSNFRIEGFVQRPALEDLVVLGHRFGVPVIEDLGSGLIDRPAGGALRDEPTVRQSVAAGADLVCFSGDKLLGGPQAGIVVGGARLVDLVRRHPLMRALRVDKLTYAALDATLLEHAAGRASDTVPVLRMLAASLASIEARAAALARDLQGWGWKTELVNGASTAGGGSAPGSELPTCLVALSHEGWSADRLDARLRGGDPPVVARIDEGRVVLDLRTVRPQDDRELLEALRRCTNEPRHG
jgi:L-seryl-tRNA(Ser) seleniumtransferase